MLYFFFFKQKTAYEMRISDWSSDVCSSDLSAPSRTRSWSRLLSETFGAQERDEQIDEQGGGGEAGEEHRGRHRITLARTGAYSRASAQTARRAGQAKIGRASCRERVCQDV